MKIVSDYRTYSHNVNPNKPLSKVFQLDQQMVTIHCSARLTTPLQVSPAMLVQTFHVTTFKPRCKQAIEEASHDFHTDIRGSL